MVEVIIVEIFEDIHIEKEFLKYISDERKVRIHKYKNQQDKKRSILAEFLIKKAAFEKLRIPVGVINIRRNSYGKPFIENAADFNFNLSHSGSYVVLAVSNDQVGIDIEKRERIDFGIAQRFFTEKETESILILPTQPEKADEFYKLWTLKESYVKALGYGLNIPLNSFEFHVGDKIKVKDESHSLQFQFYTTALNDYNMSVCYRESGINTKFLYMKDVQLCEYVKGLYDKTYN